MLEIKNELKGGFIKNIKNMLDINKLKDTGYFTEITLEKGDVLFNEGDIDNNIYIILVGELSVEKYTTKSKNETKILGFLGKDDVFGEAALNTNEAKQVNIVSRTKSKLLYISAKKLITTFSITYKDYAFSLLMYIIYLSNKRLSESNSLITATYKISNEISKLNDINIKSIFMIIEKMKEALNVDDIVYYEINPVMNNYITRKYDTRKIGKLLNDIIEINNNELDLLEYRADGYYTFKQKLSIGSNDIGYLIFLKKGQKFSDSDKKVFITTSGSIAGLIKQKQLMDEQRDKEFMQE
ncbi:cyclic nucleotide-binding domain-containing protein [Candidatus Gracilibacteria bacterium]|nr:cyclic nucleotide-binding domain-containing protein [Candidatus Gracilibacteria bacterium]